MDKFEPTTKLKDLDMEQLAEIGSIVLQNFNQMFGSVCGRFILLLPGEAERFFREPNATEIGAQELDGNCSVKHLLDVARATAKAGDTPNKVDGVLRITPSKEPKNN